MKIGNTRQKIMIKLKCYVKYLLVKTIRQVLKLLWVLPLRENDVLFISFGGKQYSCNPKALSLAIQAKYPDKKIVWAIVEGKKIVPETEGFVIKIGSLKWLVEACTARTIISNTGLSTYIPLRKRQIYIETWHGGGPGKKEGKMTIEENIWTHYALCLQNERNFAVLSSSKFFTKEVIYDSFGYTNAVVLEFGQPRNDLLFTDHAEIKRKIYKRFGLKDNVKIVLYAPTFRGDTKAGKFIENDMQLSANRCLAALKHRFGKEFVFLFRRHPYMPYVTMCETIDVTNYPNMQELLCAADVLITDYSSCMSDFALMKKPIFLYVPDCNEYMEKQGFYRDIETLPFPNAKNKEAFLDNIEKFDTQEYYKMVCAYNAEFASFETGHATEKTLEYLQNKWIRRS